jgi:hypothetical protein
MENKEDKGKAGTLRKIADFLFGRRGTEETGDINNQYLGMRTIIEGRETFNALTYYQILERHCNSKIAGRISGTIMTELVSIKGTGRNQGVEVMKAGQFPNMERLLQGYERKEKPEEINEDE